MKVGDVRLPVIAPPGAGKPPSLPDVYQGSRSGAHAPAGAGKPPVSLPPGQAAEVPATAPPGTDPALWKVLTAEERAFFARSESLGPLTYAPGSAAEARETVARGGRIDVRV